MSALRRILLLFGLLGVGYTTSGWAQTQECELLPGAREASRRIVAGEEYLYISGPARFVCEGDVVLQADSAVGARGLGEVELIGNVFFQDSTQTLTAAWARYLRAEARLIAREDVVLTDRKSQSTIQGTELEYLPAHESRPESEAIVQGRPHATIYQAGGSEPADSDAPREPYEVDSDIMRIYGDSRFLALGRVEISHSKLIGFAREAEFDQGGGLMILTGNARLEGEEYDLLGERIEAYLEEEVLQRVIANGEAALRAEDLDLESDRLQIFFDDGDISRLVATGPAEARAESLATGDTMEEPPGVDEFDGAPPAPLARQPIVISSDFRLAADSIDVHAPGKELDRVIAIGRAVGIRAADSLDHGLPEVISRDWLSGDTITGYFQRELEPAKGDESRERTVLERLIAVGADGGARSLYRIHGKERGAEPPSANYLIADRITLIMSDGEVRDVEADGPIEGMHLQPVSRPEKRSHDEPDRPVGGPR